MQYITRRTIRYSTVLEGNTVRYSSVLEGLQGTNLSSQSKLREVLNYILLFLGKSRVLQCLWRYSNWIFLQGI